MIAYIRKFIYADSILLRTPVALGCLPTVFDSGFSTLVACRRSSDLLYRARCEI